MEWILIYLLSVSGVCLGIRAASEPGMIFFKASEDFKRIAGEWLHKPLFGCAACMSSTWGSLVFWLMACLSGAPLGLNCILWPVIIFTSVFINSALWVWYKLHMSKYDP